MGTCCSETASRPERGYESRLEDTCLLQRIPESAHSREELVPANDDQVGTNQPTAVFEHLSELVPTDHNKIQVVGPGTVSENRSELVPKIISQADEAGPAALDDSSVMLPNDRKQAGADECETRTPFVDSSGQSRADELRGKLAQVEKLVDELCMYEAGLLLRELDAQLQHAFASCASQELASLGDRLRNEQLFASLRSFASRYEKALVDIMVPSQREDVEWTDVEVTDPQISDEFALKLKIRYKTKDEHDANGPWAQFSARAEIRHFPLRPSRRVSLEREVDSLRSIDDLPQSKSPGTVDLQEGDIGGRERLFSACLHTINKPRLSPWKLDNYELREFTKFKEGPLPFIRDGMISMMASSPPEDASEHAGFEIRPCVKGCKRSSGLTILRFVEAEAVPDRCRMIVMAQGGINIPSWLLPMSLVAKVFSSTLSAALRNVGLSAAPNWSTLPFQQRIDSCPQFYAGVRLCD